MSDQPDTATTPEIVEAIQRRNTDPYFYKCTLFWPDSELGDALIYGLHGMVKGSDLPVAPPTDTKDSDEVEKYQAEVYSALNAAGVLEAYRRDLAMDAQVARCPWWCTGEHAKMVGKMDPIHHQRFLGGVNFTDKMPQLHGPSEFTVRMESYQDAGPDEAVMPDVYLVTEGDIPEALDVEDVRVLAQVLAHAADRFEKLLSLS